MPYGSQLVPHRAQHGPAGYYQHLLFRKTAYILKYFWAIVGSSWAKGHKGEPSAKPMANAYEMPCGSQRVPQTAQNCPEGHYQHHLIDQILYFLKYFGVIVGSSWAKGHNSETRGHTIAIAYEMTCGSQLVPQTAQNGPEGHYQHHLIDQILYLLTYFGVIVGSSWAKGQNTETRGQHHSKCL